MPIIDYVHKCLLDGVQSYLVAEARLPVQFQGTPG